jgi:hypothetical protein
MARIHLGDYEAGLCFEHEILDCSALMVKGGSLTCALSTNSRLSRNCHSQRRKYTYELKHGKEQS